MSKCELEPGILPTSIGSLLISVLIPSIPGSVLISSLTPVTFVLDVGLEEPVSGCFGRFSFGNLVAKPAAT